jgi:hypothetical protein
MFSLESFKSNVGPIEVTSEFTSATERLQEMQLARIPIIKLKHSLSRYYKFIQLLDLHLEAGFEF